MPVAPAEINSAAQSFAQAQDDIARACRRPKGRSQEQRRADTAALSALAAGPLIGLLGDDLLPGGAEPTAILSDAELWADAQVGVLYVNPTLLIALLPASGEEEESVLSMTPHPRRMRYGRAEWRAQLHANVPAPAAEPVASVILARACRNVTLTPSRHAGQTIHRLTLDDSCGHAPLRAGTIAISDGVRQWINPRTAHPVG